MVKNVTERLKLAIKNSDYNQKQIAEKFGWHVTTLSNMVKGKSDPSVSKIEKIAKFLNINFTWLFTGRGPMFYKTEEYPMRDDLGPSRIVNDNNLQYETFNLTTADDFTRLALKAIQEEKITQEEIVAVVREVRRRRRQKLPIDNMAAKRNKVPVNELK